MVEKMKTKLEILSLSWEIKKKKKKTNNNNKHTARTIQVPSTTEHLRREGKKRVVGGGV